MVLCCLFLCQRFDDDSTYVSSYHFKFRFGCLVASFSEIAVHSVNHIFSLYFDYL